MKKLIIAAITASLFINFACVNVSAAEPTVSAASAVLINAQTGTVIYAKNENEQRAIASTTKIMTALLTAEAGDPDSAFTADSLAIRVEGTSMGLREGDIVTRRALLYGMLLPSGNDAANAAAVSVSGSMSAFVDEMNNKAKLLGLTNTHFANPSGLDADGHYSTALDMAILTRAALENECFAEICRTQTVQIEYGNPPYLRWLSNSNKLLHRYEGCIGVKTGFTDNARRCLVSAAERDGVRLIAVTLNAPNDWQDHAAMLDYGFGLVTASVDISENELVVPVIGGNVENVRLTPAATSVLHVTEQEAAEISTEIILPRFVYAGFEAGTTLGTARMYLNGEPIREVELVAATAAEKNVGQLGFLDEVFRFLGKFFG